MRQFFRITRCWFVASWFVIVAGCQQDYYGVTPVSGEVSCEGQPVPFAEVFLTPLPDAGRPAATPGKAALGSTDEHGHFKLSTYKLHDGAIVGKHQAGVRLAVDAESVAARKKMGLKNTLPCEDQKLEVVIERGNNTLRLEFGSR